MLTKSSTELVREQNRALVLSALRRDGPQSHTDLALQTGLSSATVTVITQDLATERVIERQEGPQTTGRGRPRMLFRQRRTAAHAAFLRISSDTLQYSLVDYAGLLIDRLEEKRDNAGQDAATFIASIRAALIRICGRSGVSAETLLAISISSKGLVADDGVTLLWSPVLGQRQINFRSALSPDWQAQITLSNESLLVASALHARLSRSGNGVISRLAALSLGHSIGLGVIHAERGAAPIAIAPNFGHMMHVHDGALCRCGSQGCIEAYSGFYAILRAAFEVPQNTIPARFVPFTEVEKIAMLARRGDRMAEFAFRQAGTALGNGIARLLSLHGKMPIIFTGPGIRFFDLMRKGIDDGLAASLGTRIEGPPEISLSLDEERLIFEGQLHQTLAAIDRDVIAPKTST